LKCTQRVNNHTTVMNDEQHENENVESSPEPVTPAAVPEITPEAQRLESSGETLTPGTIGPEIGEPAVDAVPSWRPADYYAAPRRAARLPRWVPLSCGVAAILALVFMAGVGAFLRSGGLAKFIAISFGQLNSEASRMFDDDVDPAARAAFSKSLLGVRDAIADGDVDLASALPVLQEMQRATRDGKLSAREVEALTATFRKSLAAPAPKAGPGDPPVVDL